MSHAGWQAVIGLECHVQLATASKMFSPAATAYGAEPNTQVDWVDAALPGTLPVPNAEAVRMAVRFGLAIGAEVRRHSVFARKNYFYPDLPKGYQISQYEEPIVEHGTLAVALDDGRTITVPIVRAHLEEDAGKSVHDAFHAATAIDLNRAGTPLLEVVTAPALHTAAEAAAYMRALHELVVWLGICDGNLQEGSFRCDANVSVRRGPDAPLGTRAEIKNVNSFRFVEKAIEYEIERQIRELEAGRSIVQETRLYDETRNQTRSMRSKESAHDYRYFPDPDLPPLVVAEALVDAERAALPELPAARRARYVQALGLSDYDAGALTASRALADYYEAVLAQLPDAAKPAANWVLGELAAALNAAGTDISAARVSPPALAGLIRRTRDGTLSSKLAKDVFAAMWADGSDADSVIAARGLGQISDDAPLIAAIDEVLAANPKQAEQFRAGDEKVFTWLVGQVMKATRGKANPGRLNELLRQRLGG
jgi:aspartyl-tRNA(Asn)/glutamyl-tRNA(Gln) amidotransferase subunit B